MNLLDFARGPALEWSLIIMLAGIFLRLAGALLLKRNKRLSKPRKDTAVWGGIRTVFTRSWLSPVLGRRVMLQQISGYVMHIGLFVVLLLLVPHIELIKALTGLSWSGLPTEMVTVVSAITIAVMFMLLVLRLTHPVLREISNADDYISWFLTTAPLVTGVMAFGHMGLPYETMLALHMLSAELLLIWIPFGKLMHMFTFIPTRYQQGAKFERRGVKV